MASSYIGNPFTPIPKSPLSHVRGWAWYWSDQLKSPILGKDFSELKMGDVLYLDHGVNFSGGLNLFGGVDDDLVDRITTLVNKRIHIISLDIPMPDYPGMLRKRLGAKSTSPKLTESLIRRFSNLLKKSAKERVTWKSLRATWLCIGDSHSTAFARRGSAVHRTNGQTLYGAIVNDHPVLNGPKPYGGLHGITLCFGSIDIRHHLMRRKRPWHESRQLFEHYLDTAKSISDEWGVDFEVCMPVPIEYDGRRIPKTGWYEGAPFFGSVHERKKLVKIFKDVFKDSGKLVSPPESWYTMDPADYAKQNMEMGGSVHMSPIRYRCRGDWDV